MEKKTYTTLKYLPFIGKMMAYLVIFSWMLWQGNTTRLPMANQDQMEMPRIAKIATLTTNNTDSTILDNFIPNRYFETFIQKNEGLSAFKFNIQTPRHNKNFSLRADNKCSIFISGQLIGDELPRHTKITLKIFPTKAAGYQTNTPIVEQDLTLKSRTRGFAFQYDKALMLPAGLYYYMLMVNKSVMPHYVGRFTVGG